MYPPRFEVHIASSLKDALEKVEEGYIPLAGGQSLIPMMKLRLISPGRLVYVGTLAELRRVEEGGSFINIGAAVTHGEIENSKLIREVCPLLSETASEIGDLQVRNMGTIGGSIAHADPAADYHAALLALDARVVVARSEGARELPYSEFVNGPYATSLEHGELVYSVKIPKAQGGYAYVKFTKIHTDFAIAGVAVLLEATDDLKIRHIRIGVTGVQEAPFRATWLEEAFQEAKLTEETINKALSNLPIRPISDARADEQLRLKVFRYVVKKAVNKALSRLKR